MPEKLEKYGYQKTQREEIEKFVFERQKIVLTLEGLNEIILVIFKINSQMLKTGQRKDQSEEGTQAYKARWLIDMDFVVRSKKLQEGTREF